MSSSFADCNVTSNAGDARCVVTCAVTGWWIKSSLVASSPGHQLCTTATAYFTPTNPNTRTHPNAHPITRSPRNTMLINTVCNTPRFSPIHPTMKILKICSVQDLFFLAKSFPLYEKAEKQNRFHLGCFFSAYISELYNGHYLLEYLRHTGLIKIDVSLNIIASWWPSI